MRLQLWGSTARRSCGGARREQGQGALRACENPAAGNTGKPPARGPTPPSSPPAASAPRPPPPPPPPPWAARGDNTNVSFLNFPVSRAYRACYGMELSGYFQGLPPDCRRVGGGGRAGGRGRVGACPQPSGWAGGWVNWCISEQAGGRESGQLCCSAEAGWRRMPGPGRTAPPGAFLHPRWSALQVPALWLLCLLRLLRCRSRRSRRTSPTWAWTLGSRACFVSELIAHGPAWGAWCLHACMHGAH